MRASLQALVFVLVALTFASAESNNSQLTSNPIFQKNCAKCHGKTAEGRHFGGPSLVAGKSAALSEEELRNLVANGKGRMPKYAGKLSQEEIDTLVRQIKEARIK